MGEHLPCKQGVTSSNLVISTMIIMRAADAARMGRDESLLSVSHTFDAERIFEEYP